MDAHMVKQTITYSDGTETVINYRGVIENGVLTPDNSMEETNPIESPAVEESVVEAPVEEAVEVPAEVSEVASEEVVEEVSE